MKVGTTIHNITEIVGIPGCKNCNQMRDDFDNAEKWSDYTNAVLDRIRKRGKYKQEKTNNASISE